MFFQVFFFIMNLQHVGAFGIDLDCNQFLQTITVGRHAPSPVILTIATLVINNKKEACPYIQLRSNSNDPIIING